MTGISSLPCGNWAESHGARRLGEGVVVVKGVDSECHGGLR